ncbi:MAG: TetR/AcrR family transcriptional regulator [Clostridia bacterium]|nr:TetR/AcrR family transcriptional regulator [Clostridia bacterium]
MTTKERIVSEALTLFSRKGYKGTSVKDIAAAVGVKDSSLYKHFKSKQDILDAIMATIKDHIQRITESFGLPTGTDYDGAAAFYATLTQDDLVALSNKIFLFYLKDDLLSKFWRMGSMEQFHNPQVYALFRRFFLEDSIQYQAALFSEMIRHHIFIAADPEVMAVSFYTPIFFLLSKYAGLESDEAEALAALDKQVREFYRVYKAPPAASMPI